MRRSEYVLYSAKCSFYRYRSRGNFAALVDPLKSRGRASSALSESASGIKWLQLSTVIDNATSPIPVTDNTAVPGFATSYTTSGNNISAFAADSIEIRVLKTDVNDSADAAISTSVAIQPLKNVSFLVNVSSTLATSGDWNCNKTKKSLLTLQAALKLRMSASAVALFVYALGFLFTLVAALAITGVALSLLIRGGRSSHVAGRQSPPPSLTAVLAGFVAVSTVSRALCYVAGEFRLIAAAVTPGDRRVIYECWFPFILAAYFLRQRVLYGVVAAAGNNDSMSPEKGRHVKRFWRVGFQRDLCISVLALSSYLAFVVSVCLLIEFCAVPVESVFVLRLLFALFAVLLSAESVLRIASSSVRHTATQVVLRASFVICAGFSAVDAASLLSDDFASLLQQNADALIAVQTANSLAELVISVVLCADSSLMFSGLGRETGRKNGSARQKDVTGTKADAHGWKMLNCRHESTLSAKSPPPRQSWLDQLLSCYGTSRKKSKVTDVDSAPAAVEMSFGGVHAVGWASTEESANVDGVVSPPPPPQSSRVMTRSKSMLYNDHGFIRFRLDGDTTDGDSDARTLDDDDGGGPPGQLQVPSVPASEYASADDLSSRRGGGPSSSSAGGTPHWSRPGSPTLAWFRAPSIHLQDSIDRALDRCDIWRVGREPGQLSVDELRRIVQLYADVGGNYRRGGNNHRRRPTAGTTTTNCTDEM